MIYKLNFEPIITDDISDVEQKEGQLIFDIVTGSIYVDIEDQRIKFTGNNDEIKHTINKIEKNLTELTKDTNKIEVADNEEQIDFEKLQEGDIIYVAEAED